MSFCGKYCFLHKKQFRLSVVRQLPFRSAACHALSVPAWQHPYESSIKCISLPDRLFRPSRFPGSNFQLILEYYNVSQNVHRAYQYPFQKRSWQRSHECLHLRTGPAVLILTLNPIPHGRQPL